MLFVRCRILDPRAISSRRLRHRKNRNGYHRHRICAHILHASTIIWARSLRHQHRYWNCSAYTMVQLDTYARGDRTGARPAHLDMNGRRRCWCAPCACSSSIHTRACMGASVRVCVSVCYTRTMHKAVLAFMRNGRSTRTGHANSTHINVAAALPAKPTLSTTVVVVVVVAATS